MLRVGIVAEGPSDWLVLEEVMKTVHAEIEFVHLQPNQTLYSSLGQGWRGVRAWCVKNGPRLELIMNGDTASPLHILVIHADCSMADKAKVDRPCPPASDTAVALGIVIERMVGSSSEAGIRRHRHPVAIKRCLGGRDT